MVLHEAVKNKKKCGDACVPAETQALMPAASPLPFFITMSNGDDEDDEGLEDAGDFEDAEEDFEDDDDFEDEDDDFDDDEDDDFDDEDEDDFEDDFTEESELDDFDE